MYLVEFYANTENIDGPFTNKHFDDDGGNLYKEVLANQIK